MIGMTKTIARAYAAEGILAFAVAPGFTVSEMTEEYLQGRGGAQIVADIPLGRVASTTEVAEVDPLARDRCARLLDRLDHRRERRELCSLAIALPRRWPPVDTLRTACRGASAQPAPVKDGLERSRAAALQASIAQHLSTSERAASSSILITGPHGHILIDGGTAEARDLDRRQYPSGSASNSPT